MAKVDLRTFVFIDSLQPQLTSYICTIARGYLPISRDAAMIIEVAPGIAINRITDIAVKKTDVRPAIQFVERAYGTLEIHHTSQSEVQEAGRNVLTHLELREADRLKPSIQTSEIITQISDYQAMLINRVRFGNMFLTGKTLYIMEVHPAGYAAFAANEAEKASPIELIDVQFSGAFGRLYLAGSEAEIEEAAKAVHKALAGIDGREGKVGGGG
jgi:ethanolamine utilization microcompartment shell protein EutS